MNVNEPPNINNLHSQSDALLNEARGVFSGRSYSAEDWDSPDADRNPQLIVNAFQSRVAQLAETWRNAGYEEDVIETEQSDLSIKIGNLFQRSLRPPNRPEEEEKRDFENIEPIVKENQAEGFEAARGRNVANAAQPPEQGNESESDDEDDLRPPSIPPAIG